MRYLGWADEVAKTGSWTCRRCLRSRPKAFAYFAAYTTKLGILPLRNISVRRFSQLRRSAPKSFIFKDVRLITSKSISLPSNGPLLNDSTWKSRGMRRGVIIAILAFGSIWAFSDDAKHRYVAVKRAFRVFSALVRCLREYVLSSVISHLQRSCLHN